MDGARSGPSLIKKLAACNQVIRERSLRLLIKTWLPSQSHLSDDDMKKLWKGLFYCVWHADKVTYQSQLIDRLATLLLTLDLPLCLHYFSVFLVTMRREWNGIDALRLDKFYLLIRRFLHTLFGLFKKHAWDVEFVTKFMGVLEERTLGSLNDVDDGGDKLLGHGVSYHLGSIFLEELRVFLPLKLEVLEVLFRPLVDVMGRSSDKVLLGKIRSNVFDVLLKTGKGLLEARKDGNDVGSSDDVVVYGTIGLKMRFSAKFFELGSKPECLQGNRKVLFSLHEGFLKLEKALASSGVEIPMPEVGVDGDEEERVPELIPLASLGLSEVNANGISDKKAAKKLKKGKKASLNGEKAKKKSKGKRKDVISEDDSMEKGNIEVVSLNPDSSIDERTVMFNESMMSNLQKQFEMVAAEEGLNEDVASACDSPTPVLSRKASKKRKRAKSENAEQTRTSEVDGQENRECGLSAKNEQSVKKVRFSMKNNLVWKPHTPLPPQSLRIPPSVTPRGSALKPGLSPGPIRDVATSPKKVKQRARTAKKIRKTVKSISPSVKRVKKVKFVRL